MELDEIIRQSFGKRLKVRTLSVTDMLANNYEPKTTHRWLLSIEGMDSFFVKSAQRPQFSRDFDGLEILPMTFEFYDPIAPSGAQQVYEWLMSEDERNAKLLMLDPLGSVVEEWDFSGLELDYVDFGKLDYAVKEAATIRITCSCDRAELYL